MELARCGPTEYKLRLKATPIRFQQLVRSSGLLSAAAACKAVQILHYMQLLSRSVSRAGKPKPMPLSDAALRLLA